MKGLTLTIAILLFTIFCPVSAQEVRTDTITFTKFNQILNTQFRSVVTGHAGTAPGSYAALDLSEEKKVDFGFNASFKKTGNVFGGKLKAGVTDGFSDIFTNSKLNSNVTLGIEYHMIRFGKKPLRYIDVKFNKLQVEKFRDTRLEVEHSYSKDSLSIEYMQKRLLIQAEKDKTDTLLVKLKRRMKSIPPPSDKVMDSLRYAIKVAVLDSIYIKKKLDSIPDISDPKACRKWRTHQQLLLNNETAPKLTECDSLKLDVKGFEFGWFSFGFQARSDQFRLIDTAAVNYVDRITKKNNVGYQLSIKYSFYRWRSAKRGTFFASLGFTYYYKSNLEDLTGIDAIITRTHGSNNNESLTTTEKYTAYEAAAYKPGINQALLEGDIYYFLNREKTFAVHGFPNVKFIEATKPICNMGIGLLYPIKNKEEDKSIVNAEIYYSLTDIFRSSPSRYKLFEQNKVGVRFSFPINFIVNKKSKS